LAWALGVAIAQLFPGNVANPPLTEQFLRRSEAAVDGVRGWWPQSEVAPPTVETTPQAAPSPTPLVLDATVQQQVEGDLSRLEADLQVLRDRANRIETQLGILPSQEPLEPRLRSLRQRLDPNADLAALAPQPITVATDENHALRITLPSTLLFEADGQQLKPSSYAILDSVATDLQAYPNATIHVEGYPDAAADSAPSEQRQRSFDQASAIAQQLQTRLGERYQWLSVGHGVGRPADSTNPAAPTNAHVEIRIDPD
jgi:outer membrane protein OmpA-like peptidoglycan-associated protein